MPAPSSLPSGIVGFLVSRFRLRFPTVFLLLATVTILDFIVPDVIPFADEIGLTLLTILFGLWRERKPAASEPPREVPPPLLPKG
jgi:hypothetical protein